MKPTAGARENARQAVRNLLDGNPPNGIAPADCGPYAGLIEGLNAAHEIGGTNEARRQFSIEARQDPDLASLAAADPEPKKRYSLHWLPEAMEEQAPIEWVVQGLFSVGSLSLIVGDPGSKKTWLMLDAALAVATGEQWIGRDTMRGPALIIDEESGQRRLGRRLGALARARHVPQDTPLAYVTLEQFDFRTEEDVAALAELVEEVRPRFVLVDALVDVMPGGDENAVKDVQPVVAALRKVAEDTGAAITLIHHTNKGGKYRGSSAISGAVDLMLKVESKADSLNIDLSSEKVRDVEPFSMAAHIRFQKHPEKFIDAWKVFVTAADPTPPEPSYSAGERYVLEYLQAHGASEVGNILAGAGDTCAESTARTAVYSLAKKGLVERTNESTRGVPATYDLTGQGKGLEL